MAVVLKIFFSLLKKVVILAVFLALLIGLIVAGIAGFILFQRPGRENYAQTLFHGITYTIQAKSEPRSLMIHVLKIDLTAEGIKLEVTPTDSPKEKEISAQTTSEFLLKSKAQVAINGGFFQPFKPGDFAGDNYFPHTGDAVDVIGQAMAYGKEYSPDDISYPKLCISPSDVIIQMEDCPEKSEHILAGSHIIMKNGDAVPSKLDAHAKPEPRTVVGLSEDRKTLFLVVVDGRQKWYSEGVTWKELVPILRQMNVDTALNLDGGGSSTMVMQTEGGFRLLNSPQHTNIPLRERPVANHLAIFAQEVEKE